jgi:hypothetical protein
MHTQQALTPGMAVKLRAYRGEIIDRKIVALSGSTVYVSRSDEYQRAKNEHRQPRAVGFNLSDVIQVVASEPGKK